MEFAMFLDQFDTQPLVSLTACGESASAGSPVTVDIRDARTDRPLCSVKKRRFTSVLRNTWDICDTEEHPIGIMREQGLPLVHRVFRSLSTLHHIEADGKIAATIFKDTGPETPEYDIDLSDSDGRIDAKMVLACSILVAADDARRELVKGDYHVAR